MATDKVAIITAGGSGMGAAAARRLAADGYRVAILSSSGKGETLAKELGGIGVTGSKSPADAPKAGARLRLLSAVRHCVRISCGSLTRRLRMRRPFGVVVMQICG